MSNSDQQTRAEQFRELRAESRRLLLNGDPQQAAPPYRPIDEATLREWAEREERQARERGDGGQAGRRESARRARQERGEILYRSQPQAAAADWSGWEAWLKAHMDKQSRAMTEAFGSAIQQLLVEHSAECKAMLDAKVELLRNEMLLRIAETKASLAERMCDTLNDMRRLQSAMNAGGKPPVVDLTLPRSVN
jgi:hypothetical protein